MITNKIGKLKEKHQEKKDFESDLHPSIDDYVDEIKNIKDVKDFLRRLTKYIMGN